MLAIVNREDAGSIPAWGAFCAILDAMPYKDPLKQREHSRKWAAAKRAGNPDAIRDVVKARYQLYRTQAINLLGGICTKCGGTEKLEYHHIAPRIESGGVKISEMLRRSCWAGIKAEVLKCHLLCQSCHNLHHYPTAKQHGTESRYNKGCRCQPCRDARHAKYLVKGH